MTSAHVFLDGLVFGIFAIIALFQLRFWRRSGDRLFLFFALAFAVLAVNRVALALTAQVSEPRTTLYVVRLVAFCIILYAIWDKNRRNKAPVDTPAPTPTPSSTNADVAAPSA